MRTHIPEPCWTGNSLHFCREAGRAPCTNHRCGQWGHWHVGNWSWEAGGFWANARRCCRRNEECRYRSRRMISSCFFIFIIPSLIASFSSISIYILFFWSHCMFSCFQHMQFYSPLQKLLDPVSVLLQKKMQKCVISWQACVFVIIPINESMVQEEYGIIGRTLHLWHGAIHEDMQGIVHGALAWYCQTCDWTGKTCRAEKESKNRWTKEQ